MSCTSASPHFVNVNGVPRTAEGKVFHLELRDGDAAANVITVGSESRARILASLLDDDSVLNGGTRGTTTTSTTPTATIPFRSQRGFVTYTGTFNNVPVSIVMINMGYPNMDFFVRELREVTQGPLRIIRLGSCAGLRSDLPVGTVAVASEGSTFVRQNPDSWAMPFGKAPNGQGSASAVTESGEGSAGSLAEPYAFHDVVPADKELTGELLKELNGVLGGPGGIGVVGCLNASADSFYSSQGRVDRSFDDRNTDVVERLVARYPLAGSFEMETFHLFHLARLCRKSTIQVSAASIVLANRIGGDAITADRVAEIERKAGQAALRAITTIARGSNCSN